MDGLASVFLRGAERVRLAANWFRPLATGGRFAHNHSDCQAQPLSWPCATPVVVSCGEGDGRCEPPRAAPELRHETIPVSPIHRPHVLDDLVGVGARHPFEDECWRVERHAESGRLLFSGDGRLDGLEAGDDLDPVALVEQLVERMLLEVAGAEVGDERLSDVEGLDRHRLAIGEPQARRDDDGLGRRDVEDPPQPRAGGNASELERSAGRAHAALAHVLGEGGHRQLLRDLRLADERPGAAAAHEITLAHELVEGCPHRQPRHAEVRAERALGRDGVPDRELLDQVEHPLACLGLLRHSACRAGSRDAGVSAVEDGGVRLAPVSGSKKWNPVA